MKSVSLKLPDLLDAKLASQAKRRGASKSAVVREALETYFAGNGTSSKTSFAELAREFVGCVKGAPPDLSYNKKYLKGLGR